MPAAGYLSIEHCLERVCAVDRRIFSEFVPAGGGKKAAGSIDLDCRPGGTVKICI
jgi:hypothetical protein